MRGSGHGATQHHASVAPAIDAPRAQAHPAVGTLDDVGRRQAPSQRRRHAQPNDSEHLGQALPQACPCLAVGTGRAGVFPLQPPASPALPSLPENSAGGPPASPPSPDLSDGRAGSPSRSRSCDGGSATRDSVCRRRRQCRLAGLSTRQSQTSPAGPASPRPYHVFQQPPSHHLILDGPFGQTQEVLAPSRIHADCDQHLVLAEPHSIEINHQQVEIVESSLALTASRLTADRDTPTVSAIADSTASYWRVETPRSRISNIRGPIFSSARIAS